MKKDIVGKLYNNFIQTNIQAMCSCYKPMWIHPKDLQVRRQKEIEQFKGKAFHLDKGDPYLTATWNKQFDLGMDLLNNGTYWPFLVHKRPEGYFVREGNHRIAAIKILLEQGKWPNNRLVFCMVYEKNVYDPTYKLKQPVKMVKIKLNDEGQPLQELTTVICSYATEVMATFNFSTPYFRNWIWGEQTGIKPSPFINKFITYKYYWLDGYNKIEGNNEN